MSAASRSMARRHDRQARDLGPGPSLPRDWDQSSSLAANDNRRSGPSHASTLPPDARAIIEPAPMPVNQAGRAREGTWRVRFAERWHPQVDPLTGWTGGSDPLALIDLRFPDCDAAERYCRREGVPFELRGLPAMRPQVRPCLAGEAPPRLCCWPTGPHPRCCGEYPTALALQDDPAPRTSAVASAG